MFKDLYEKYKIYGFKIFFLYAVKEFGRIFYWQTIKRSYSQSGEDLFIDQTLGFKKKGFYIDIGASDPNRFNNTKRFYLKGWYGINIEPNTTFFKKIKKYRRRDINLNIGIGDKEGKINFFIFFPYMLSTFSEKTAKDYIKQGFKMIEKTKIEVKRLTDVLKKYSERKVIDFLSIDTEGYDLDILKSNNWEKYRPKAICVEVHTHGEIDSKNLTIEKYLKSVGYIKKFDNNLNGIFIDTKIN